jgi:hypothetical protein
MAPDTFPMSSTALEFDNLAFWDPTDLTDLIDDSIMAHIPSETSTTPATPQSIIPSPAPSTEKPKTSRKLLKKNKDLTKKPPVRWTDAQEKLLLDVLRCASDTGMKGQGGYKKQVYNQVVVELQVIGIRLSVEQVQNKVDYFKRKWQA